MKWITLPEVDWGDPSERNNSLKEKHTFLKNLSTICDHALEFALKLLLLLKLWVFGWKHTAAEIKIETVVPKSWWLEKSETL